MDDLKDILLDGEEVLWSGAPDPSLVTPLAPFWRRKLFHLIWTIGFLLFAATLTYYATTLNLDGLFKGIVGFVITAIMIGVIFSFLSFVDFRDRAHPPDTETYYLTNLRLLTINRTTKRRLSIFAGHVSSVEVAKSGISLGGDSGEGSWIALRGIKDSAEIEKLIIETLVDGPTS